MEQRTNNITKEMNSTTKVDDSQCVMPSYVPCGYLVEWDNGKMNSFYLGINVAELEMANRECCGFKDVRITPMFKAI